MKTKKVLLLPLSLIALALSGSTSGSTIVGPITITNPSTPSITSTSVDWGGGTPPGGGGNVTIGNGMNTYSLSLHAQGDHSITVNEITYTFTNISAYGKTTCYSDSSVTGS